MDDLTISKSLADALGWPRKSIDVLGQRVIIRDGAKDAGRVFDYRDPTVYEGIVKRFGFKLEWSSERGKWQLAGPTGKRPVLYSDTPAKLIALHVLAVAMSGETFRAFLTKRSAEYQEGASSAFELVTAVASVHTGSKDPVEKAALKLARNWVTEAQKLLSR